MRCAAHAVLHSVEEGAARALEEFRRQQELQKRYQEVCGGAVRRCSFVEVMGAGWTTQKQLQETAVRNPSMI
jgi:hypothetical protein